jgi:succinate-semialdehyde dehydrogenase/glutarate-semialdehyde dehydrogenase
MDLKLDRLTRPVPAGLFIDGQWRSASDGVTYDVMNPAEAAAVGAVADASVTDGWAALEAAAGAQPAWASWSARDRVSVLRGAHDLLLERTEELAAAVVYETGKPLAEARGEVLAGAEALLWNIEQAAHIHGTIAPASRGGFDVISRYAPVGPCLLITPWNFPMLTPLRKIGAALAAGCTVIFKPAPQTPIAALMLAAIFDDAGLPPGVFNLLTTTRDREISAALMQDLRLRKVSFTGSTAGGSHVLRQAAPLAINTSMELGGDAPFIVLSDADIDLAVAQAIACKFRNAGQVCIAPNRFILHTSVAQEFTDKLVAAVTHLPVGDGFADGTLVGPMISAAQRDRAVAMIDESVRGGARVLTGGTVPDRAGFFLTPTVVADVPAGVGLSCDEIFGPVAALYRVDSAEEAVRVANDTDRGLAAYVFSADLGAALRVADRLEVGIVGVNRALITDPAAPFGGVKTSGIGREGGHDAIREYLEVKYLAVTPSA